MGGLDWFVGDLPSNRRIVATLLDVLLQSGEATAHLRVRQALDLGAEGLPRRGPWLDEAQVRAAFQAAGDAPRLARRVGQALVRLEGLGPLLCHTGVATVEKAYRRSHQLLAREAEHARFARPEMAGARATIRFEPGETSSQANRPGSGGAVFCEMRQGQLEALPMIFGLLPATVRETACAHRGAEACTFEVRWSRRARKGLFTGVAAGLLGTLAAVAWSRVGGPPLAPVVVLGFCGTLLAGLAGRVFDLSRQLEAVAGARRGQLALLDQVDQSLAEKLDELAKVGTTPTRLPARAAATAPTSAEGLVPVQRERAVSPRPPSPPRERLALGEVLGRAKANIARDRAGVAAVTLQGPAEPLVVEGDGLQIEFMIEQLLLNALDASEGSVGVRLSLAHTPAGAEIVVEDRGPGIAPETFDEAFDPFFEGAPAGVSGGLGLPICYRIVAEHGGQLHVESRPGEGTRVRVLLPEAGRA